MRCLDHVIPASVVPKMVASRAHAALVPSVGRHVNNLLNIGLNSHCVLSASRAAIVEVAWRISLVIEHKEVVR